MDEVNRSLRRKEEVDGEGCSSANPFNIRRELMTINQRGQRDALFSSLAALSVRTLITSRGFLWSCEGLLLSESV